MRSSSSEENDQFTAARTSGGEFDVRGWRSINRSTAMSFRYRHGQTRHDPCDDRCSRAAPVPTEPDKRSRRFSAQSAKHDREIAVPRQPMRIGPSHGAVRSPSPFDQCLLQIFTFHCEAARSSLDQLRGGVGYAPWRARIPTRVHVSSHACTEPWRRYAPGQHQTQCRATHGWGDGRQRVGAGTCLGLYPHLVMECRQCPT